MASTSTILLSFVCHLCHKSYSTRSNLNRHMAEVHNQTLDICIKSKSSFQCTICSNSCSNFSSFEEHVSKEHGIVLKSETLSFKSTQEFNCWKNSVEENETCCFANRSGTKKVFENSSLTYYQCNRSGFFNSKQDRKRKLKVQGSCKINGFCPSRIKAKFINDGSVHVVYCSTHIGHKPELAHKPLSFKDRQNIATQLAKKVPFTEILNSAHTSIDEENHQRIQMLTRHDLHNIAAEFRLNSDSMCHTNDAVSVEAWVESEKQQYQSNCVILNEPQSEEHISLKEDVFMDITSRSKEAEVIVIDENEVDKKLGILKDIPDKDVSHKSLGLEKLLRKEQCDRIIEAITTLEDNSFVKQALNNIEAKLKAVKQKNNKPLVTKTKSSVNKNIQLQRRFVSKLKSKKVVSQSKRPTSKEVEQMTSTSSLE